MAFQEKYESIRNEWALGLRNRLWGAWRLRGIPQQAPVTEVTRGEREFYRRLLERWRALADAPEFVPAQLIDVGCRNWSYAQALVDFFPETRSFVGVEVDGSRRYWNLRRRRDLAEAYARDASRGRPVAVSCRFQDFRTLGSAELLQDAGAPRSTPRLFTFFYPFVSSNPCLKWGLPSRFGEFESPLREVRRLAKELEAPSCWILSCHQGEWEFELARKAYESVGIPIRHTCIAPKEFQGLWPSPFEVHLVAAQVYAPHT